VSVISQKASVELMRPVAVVSVFEQMSRQGTGMPVRFVQVGWKPLLAGIDLPPALRGIARRERNESFAMPKKSSENSAPAAPRCPCCAQPMCLARKTPRFGGLPDLYTFECRSCEISHIEESGLARWRDTNLFQLFRKQARECRRLATLAQDSNDRSFWLRLSDHWLKLAQDTGRRTG
jgi:hypothetical protein